MRTHLFALSFVALVALSDQVTTWQAALAKIEVSPPGVHLSGTRDRQLVVVQAAHADGITRDATVEATITPDNPALVLREGNAFWPVADGASELTDSFGGQTVRALLTVTQAAVTPPLSFRLDVMPILLRAGCNMGSCHGSARGKGRLSALAFRLSSQRRLLPPHSRNERQLKLRPQGPRARHL